jgi:hypothetical protein
MRVDDRVSSSEHGFQVQAKMASENLSGISFLEVRNGEPGGES